MSRALAPLFAAAVAASAAGCPTPEGAIDAGATGVAELGTGTTSYVPIVDEQELGLVRGPQGGFHFIVHGRMTGIAPGDPTRPGIPENPTTRFAAYREDGRQIDVQAPPWRGGYEAGTDGWYELPSGRILQIENPEVPTLYGTRVRITINVRDAEGHVGADERWVVARDWDELLPDAGPTPPADAAPVDAPGPDAP